MSQPTLHKRLVTGLATIVFSGCMPQMTIEDMKSSMPRRPPELDKLNAFVGQWKVAGEATMAGLDRPLGFSGTNEANWEGDASYLVARGVTDMADLGETHGMAAWTYDVGSSKFRGISVSSTGEIGTATARHNEQTDTWHMRAVSHGAGGKMLWKGRVRFIDRNTKEEHWTGYAMGGLIKTVEMTKTETRR
jgi:hypothetical protein